MTMTVTAAHTETMWTTDCLRCDKNRSIRQENLGDRMSAFMSRLIVCGDCGNKRCPKATWHDNECTSSNEPGQPGSDYPLVRGFDWNLTKSPLVA